MVRIGLTYIRSLRRACNYSIPGPPRTAAEEEIILLRARVEELEKLVDRSITANKDRSASPALSPIGETYGASQSRVFSNLFFLDHMYFTHLHCNVQPVLVSVPNDIANILKDEYDQPRGIEQLVSRYFDAIHGWMPIISKTRMKRVLDRPVGDVQADTAFLLSCMKLLLHSPQSSCLPEDLPLYRTAKSIGLQLEIAGLQSLMFVQGGILIAVYELGHGIYPASYTSVAHCARQAVSIGLHDREKPHFLQPWADWEEEIRVWWFVVMLDRYAKAFQSEKKLIKSGMLLWAESVGRYAPKIQKSIHLYQQTARPGIKESVYPLLINISLTYSRQ